MRLLSTSYVVFRERFIDERRKENKKQKQRPVSSAACDTRVGGGGAETHRVNKSVIAGFITTPKITKKSKRSSPGSVDVPPVTLTKLFLQGWDVLRHGRYRAHWSLSQPIRNLSRLPISQKFLVTYHQVQRLGNQSATAASAIYFLP